MGRIGIINRDRDVINLFEKLKEQNGSDEYEFIFLRDEKEAVHFIKNELPHLIVVNFTDLHLDIGLLLDSISQDNWLYNFGIIALYHRDETTDEKLQAEFAHCNIILSLPYDQINHSLIPPLKLVDHNYQLILQKPVSSNLTGEMSGSFFIENDLSNLHIYSRILVQNLVNDGMIPREGSVQVESAIIELLTNGIEHGNCRISFEEREKAFERGISAHDLVKIKNQHTLHASRRVNLSWERREKEIYIKVTDQGEGFDSEKLNLELANDSPISLPGGGIAIANMIGDQLFYNKKGNCATLVLNIQEQTERPIPEGFMNEEIVIAQPGDVIFEEGTVSNHLFYISRGSFSVYCGKKKVATLDGSDIFMGEMAFLMNNTRSATVRADTPSRLVKISRESFLDVLKEYPHYGIYLSRLLAQRLNRANQMNFKLKSALASRKA